MIIMDGTIVGVALPVIIADLGLDLANAQWVTSAYSVVFAALLLVFGRLGDRFGRKTLFLLGVVLFAVASGAAGFATTAGALIGLRVLQAVGGAMILPATLSTVNATFRGKDRAAAFGIWGAVMAGSAALGPLLGGVLTSQLSWRWIFWVNLPIAAVIIVVGARVVDQSRGDRQPGWDLFGPVLSVIGFSLVVFALIEGNSLGWWRPSHEFSLGGLRWGVDRPISVVVPAAGVGVLALAAFVVWEHHRNRRGQAALLDLRLFSIRSFSWGNLTALAVAVGEFGLTFTLPLYLVNAVGLSVLTAGLILAAMALGAFIAGAQARHLAARLGAAGTVVLGLVLEVIGTLVTVILVANQASAWWLTVALVIYGIGLGLASAQLTSTVLSQVPAEQSGAGSATQSTVRQVGAALGTALAGSALAVGLRAGLPTRLESAGVPAGQVDRWVTATIDSAGGTIAASAGTPGAVTEVLRSGFAQAAAASVGVAAAFLVLGLVGAIALSRATTR